MAKNFVVLLTSLLFAAVTTAAEEQSSSNNQDDLDLILQGFSDKPNPDENTQELENALQGFENQPQATDELDDELDDELKDVLQGFDEPRNASEENANTLMPGQRWDFVTLFSVSSAYNYQQKKPINENAADFRGFSRLRFKIQPELRYQIDPVWDAVLGASAFYDLAYRLNNRNTYSDQVLDSNETELEIREAFIRGPISSNLDLTLGRQIVAWGSADSIRTVDVLNPLDFREPGMVDIEDLRLPVFMLKFDYYIANWSLTGVAIPEIKMNKNPAYGSDFYFGDASSPEPKEEIPPSFDSNEYGLALQGRFQGWDLSFYWANVFDEQAYAEITENGFILKHKRIDLWGASGNIALGNWIIKSEIAYLDGLKFTRLDKNVVRSDIMIGVEYSGFSNTILSIEAANKHIINYVSDLKTPPNNSKKDEGQIFFRYSRTFLRERLELVGQASILGFSIDDGAFYRGTLRYELKQAMSIQVGGIVYQSGDSRISQIAAPNDRVFIDWRYSF